MARALPSRVLLPQRFYVNLVALNKLLLHLEFSHRTISRPAGRVPGSNHSLQTDIELEIVVNRLVPARDDLHVLQVANEGVDLELQHSLKMDRNARVFSVLLFSVHTLNK